MFSVLVKDTYYITFTVLVHNTEAIIHVYKQREPCMSEIMQLFKNETYLHGLWLLRYQVRTYLNVLKFLSQVLSVSRKLQLSN